MDANNNKSGEYKVEAIWNNAVYARELLGYLPGLYYLVSWKGYLEEKNSYKPYSAVQHLKKLISLFYKDHSDKPIATSEAINTIPPMAKPTIKPAAKPTTAPKQKKADQLITLTNELKKTKLRLIIIVFLPFLRYG